MKLPYYDKATIPPSKIVDYLLSVRHPYGRSKAEFFLKCGFTARDWQVLAEALRDHAARHAVTHTQETAFGTKFVIDGPLVVPSGKTPDVRTVWFVEVGEEIPRFVTAYPL
jgi:hypothetical protein